jgi:cation:H+ antiporter
MRPGMSLLLLPVGILLLFFAGDLVVDGAAVIARDLGFSEATIGLTLLAIGTTLPELMTTIVGTFRRHTSLVIGNLIGSCIFNALAVVGITASVRTLEIERSLATQDSLFMVAAVVILLPLMNSGWRVGRVEGILLLGLYLAYLVFVAHREGLI